MRKSKIEFINRKKGSNYVKSNSQIVETQELSETRVIHQNLNIKIENIEFQNIKPIFRNLLRKKHLDVVKELEFLAKANKNREEINSSLIKASDNNSELLSKYQELDRLRDFVMKLKNSLENASSKSEALLTKISNSLEVLRAKKATILKVRKSNEVINGWLEAIKRISINPQLSNEKNENTIPEPISIFPFPKSKSSISRPRSVTFRSKTDNPILNRPPSPQIYSAKVRIEKELLKKVFLKKLFAESFQAYCKDTVTMYQKSEMGLYTSCYLDILSCLNHNNSKANQNAEISQRKKEFVSLKKATLLSSILTLVYNGTLNRENFLKLTAKEIEVLLLITNTDLSKILFADKKVQRSLSAIRKKKILN